jgi:hypothetical protein
MIALLHEGPLNGLFKNVPNKDEIRIDIGEEPTEDLKVKCAVYRKLDEEIQHPNVTFGSYRFVQYIMSAPTLVDAIVAPSGFAAGE